MSEGSERRAIRRENLLLEILHELESIAIDMRKLVRGEGDL